MEGSASRGENIQAKVKYFIIRSGGLWADYSNDMYEVLSYTCIHRSVNQKQLVAKLTTKNLRLFLNIIGKFDKILLQFLDF